MTALVTHLGGARATVGVAILLMAIGGDLRLAGFMALVANALSHAAVQLLKRTVQRPRPCDPTGRPLALVALPDPFSFPSGHAAAATAVGTSVALIEPALAPFTLGLAVWVSWTRVALRVHYASDVVAGACLGMLGALGAHAIL